MVNGRKQYYTPRLGGKKKLKLIRYLLNGFFNAILFFVNNL